MTYCSNWTELTFGKHEGSTLPQVAFSDPGYVYWAVAKNFVTGYLATQLNDVAWKGANIKIPPSCDGEPLVAEYIRDPTGKFSHLELCPASRTPSGYRLDRIDLSVPGRMSNYDKGGDKMLLAAVKEILFGSRSFKMTRGRCEDFFLNPDYFVWPAPDEAACPEHGE
jgi:hypothetical protein